MAGKTAGFFVMYRRKVQMELSVLVRASEPGCNEGSSILALIGSLARCARSRTTSACPALFESDQRCSREVVRHYPNLAHAVQA
jgi:hypothetical protein